jgi:hypothetical protein
MELDMDYGTYLVFSNSMAAEVRFPNGKVVKRFKGETAHSDADRFAYDAFIALNRRLTSA